MIDITHSTITVLIDITPSTIDGPIVLLAKGPPHVGRLRRHLSGLGFEVWGVGLRAHRVSGCLRSETGIFKSLGVRGSEFVDGCQGLLLCVRCC